MRAPPLPLAALAAISALPIPALADPFDSCGTLVQGVTCILFQVDAGQRYIIPPPAPFQVGQRVRIVGNLDTGCFSFCLEGNGCVDWGGGGTISACPAPCPVDWDHNGAIEPADAAAFVTAWFTSLQTGTLTGDFDASGAVEPADVSLFINRWFAALTTGC